MNKSDPIDVYGGKPSVDDGVTLTCHFLRTRPFSFGSSDLFILNSRLPVKYTVSLQLSPQTLWSSDTRSRFNLLRRTPERVW